MKNTPTRDTGIRIFPTNQMVLKKHTYCSSQKKTGNSLQDRDKSLLVVQNIASPHETTNILKHLQTLCTDSINQSYRLRMSSHQDFLLYQ